MSNMYYYIMDILYYAYYAYYVSILSIIYIYIYIYNTTRRESITYISKKECLILTEQQS